MIEKPLSYREAARGAISLRSAHLTYLQPHMSRRNSLKVRSLYRCTIGIAVILLSARTTVALPPPEEISEEVLRTEILTQARSPLDGQPLTAAEYARLQAALAESAYPPKLASSIEQTIFLLQLFDFYNTISPF